jgi:cytidine deaminase
VLSDRLGRQLDDILVSLRQAPLHLTIALTVMILVVIAVSRHRSRTLRGGSRPATRRAFAAWMALTFVTEDFTHRVLVSSLAFLLAVLVAQSRVERRSTRRSRSWSAGCSDRRSPSCCSGARVMDDAGLYELARGAAALATRYSGYRVGAAALTRDGRTLGRERRNGSYGLSLCAERSVLARAVAGEPARRGRGGRRDGGSCGCRQWLLEFGVDRVLYPRAAR